MLPSEIADMVASTRSSIKPGKYTQAAQSYREYMARRLMKNIQTFGGYEHEWPVMHGTGNSAQMTGLYRKTRDSAADVFTMASAPIRFASASWIFDTKEKALNSGSKERIFNYVQSREVQCMLDWHKLMEDQCLSKPTDSNDADSIYGLQYAVVPNATQGFNGGNPSGFSTTYGIDASANAWHRNYAGTYADTTDADMVDLMEDCAEYTNWVSPVDFPDLAGSDDFVIMTNYTIRKKMKEVAESRNDNLGFDIDGTSSKLRFHGNPIVRVPALESLALVTNPIYMLNLGAWGCFTTEDGEFEKLPVEKVAGYETVYRAPIQGAVQMYCTDRRKQAVIYQA